MSGRVYIGRLTNRVRDRDVEHFFRNYGRVRDVMLKSGYGFVEFDDPRDADDAVYDLNGKELMGERVIVDHARGTSRRDDRDDYRRGYEPPRRRGGGGGGGGGGGRDKYGPPIRTGHKLIVENLSSRVSWQDLKDYMRTAGEVTYADAHKDRKNVGCVEFATRDDMKNALAKLDNTEINGRRIKLVDDSKGSKHRSRSPSRSRSRSDRRRSRSASRASSGHKKSASRSRSRSAGSRSQSPVDNNGRRGASDDRRSNGDDRRSEASGDN